MSPLAFKVLLHYYVTPVQFDKNTAHDLEVDAIQAFIADGLIEWRSGPIPPDYDALVITARGKALMFAALNLPLPVQSWTIPGVTLSSPDIGDGKA